MSRSLVCLLVLIVALVLVSPCGFAEDPSAQASLRDAITSVMSKRPELQAAAQVRHPLAQLRRRAGFITNPRHFYQSENLRPGMDITQGVDMPTRPRSSRLREDGCAHCHSRWRRQGHGHLCALNRKTGARFPSPKVLVAGAVHRRKPRGCLATDCLRPFGWERR